MEQKKRTYGQKASHAVEAPAEDTVKVRSLRLSDDTVEELNAAKKALDEFTALGYGSLPVCIAKTQYSFSDDAKLLAAPEHFTMNVRDARLSAGAGFVVVIMGNIMTMPGLPKRPAAESIDVDANGKITGLF